MRAVELATRILQAARESPLAWSGSAVPLGFSAGVAILASAEESGEATLARADAALFQSKSGGRNRCTVATG